MRLPDWLRFTVDIHLGIGPKDDDEDRYEDATGSHHDAGPPPAGFNRLVRPEEMQ